MPEDAGGEMKLRLRADLVAAMKEKRTVEAKVLRTLLAAIDNAEAPAVDPGAKPMDRHDFVSGSAEVQRRLLTKTRVREALLAEVQERESAAGEMERVQQTERAEALRAEALLVRRYLGRWAGAAAEDGGDTLSKFTEACEKPASPSSPSSESACCS